MDRAALRLVLLLFTRFVLPLVAFLPCPSSADNGARSREAPYRDGASALEFSIGPDFTLGSFTGATLSYRRHTSESAAWRMGLTVIARGGDADRDVVSDDSLSFPSIKQGREFGALSLSTTAQRLWFAGGTSPLHAYFGLGPTVGVSRTDDDLTNQRQLPGGSTVTETLHAEVHQWSVGIAGVLGVEWFMTPYLSLVADYGTSLDWQSFENSQTVTSPSQNLSDKEKGHSFGIGSNGVHFGLATWFH